MTATAVSVPITVLAALLFVRIGAREPRASRSGLPPINVAAPPAASAHAIECGRVLARMPAALKTLAPRIVHTHPESSPFVVAWGEPAVVFTCGAGRPKSLAPGSAIEFRSGGVLSGPYYAVTETHDGSTWTTVDRGPYISISFPAKYQPADYLPLLSSAITAGTHPACSTNALEPDIAKLCTRRP
jgi:hypothetical protein